MSTTTNKLALPADTAPVPGGPVGIFELLRAYNASLETMRIWLDAADLPADERIGIADAWQGEMREMFRANGFCFSCNRSLARCRCGG
jgi:hypothetical protein